MLFLQINLQKRCLLRSFQRNHRCDRHIDDPSWWAPWWRRLANILQDSKEVHWLLEERWRVRARDRIGPSRRSRNVLCRETDQDREGRWCERPWTEVPAWRASLELQWLIWNSIFRYLDKLVDDLIFDLKKWWIESEIDRINFKYKRLTYVVHVIIESLVKDHLLDG